TPIPRHCAHRIAPRVEHLRAPRRAKSNVAARSEARPNAARRVREDVRRVEVEEGARSRLRGRDRARRRVEVNGANRGRVRGEVIDLAELRIERAGRTRESAA